MKLHDVIRKIRQSKDLTQENLADELGVDKSTIVRYEKDSSIIQVEQLEKIATAFGMTASELLSYKDHISIAQESGIPIYGSAKKAMVIVELDGNKRSLKASVEMLTRLNAALT